MLGCAIDSRHPREGREQLARDRRAGERLDEPSPAGSTEAEAISTRPPETCVPPMSSAPTTSPRRHGTNALTTLQAPPTRAAQTVAPDSCRDDDRLREGQVVHALSRLDLDLLPGDQVEDVEPPRRVLVDRLLEVEPVHGEEEVGQPAQLELDPVRSSTDRPRLGNELAADRLARAARDRGSRTRARGARAAVRPRGRGAASRRSAGCTGTALR